MSDQRYLLYCYILQFIYHSFHFQIHFQSPESGYSTFIIRQVIITGYCFFPSVKSFLFYLSTIPSLCFIKRMKNLILPQIKLPKNGYLEKNLSALGTKSSNHQSCTEESHLQFQFLAVFFQDSSHVYALPIFPKIFKLGQFEYVRKF